MLACVALLYASMECSVCLNAPRRCIRVLALLLMLPHACSGSAIEWQEANKKLQLSPLHAWPAIQLLGPAKCGSTSLAKWLGQQQDICFPSWSSYQKIFAMSKTGNKWARCIVSGSCPGGALPKETHFFDSTPQSWWVNMSLQDYTGAFSPVGRCRASRFLDATPQFEKSWLVAGRMRLIAPPPLAHATRMIVVLREPATVHLSWYNMALHDYLAGKTRNAIGGSCFHEAARLASSKGLSPHYTDVVTCALDAWHNCTDWSCRIAHPRARELAEREWNGHYEVWQRHWPRQHTMYLEFGSLTSGDKDTTDDLLRRVTAFIGLPRRLSAPLALPHSNELSFAHKVTTAEACKELSAMRAQVYDASNAQLFSLLERDQDMSPKEEPRPFPRFIHSNNSARACNSTRAQRKPERLSAHAKYLWDRHFRLFEVHSAG